MVDGAVVKNLKRPLLRPAEPRQRAILSLPAVSLMFPTPQPLREPLGGSLATQWETDLGLSDLASALTAEPRYSSHVRRVLTALTTDLAVIQWRQAVLTDFLDQPDLVRGIRDLLPRLGDAGHNTAMLGSKKRLLLLETSDRLSQLELYTENLLALHAALSAARLTAPALLQLRESVRTLIEGDGFKQMQTELPTLRKPLQQLASLTVGINLNAQLEPVSAVLLAINERPIGEASSLLERLIGRRVEAADETGIAPLHVTPENREHRLLSPLFQDMDMLLTQVAQPVARSLERYVRVNNSSLTPLAAELAFFVAAADLATRLRERGLPICLPTMRPMTERVAEVAGLINLTLALRSGSPPQPSDVSFGAEGRIAVLTGPNSGGKTTFLQALGLAQVMAQTGLFVPATSAAFSPVDHLLTHFPALETRQQGRLAEEAERLRLIFGRATAHSLVLLNESLSSTAFGEALYLAQDVLAALRFIGARTVFATHLVELIAKFPEIEAASTAAGGDCDLFSLVAGIALQADGTPTPTYRITQGSPLGRSFAQEIAQRHGISLGQIMAARRKETQ